MATLSGLLGSTFVGATGPSGTITIGTITTGAEGTSANVVNSGTASAAVLDFTIPRGDTGNTGPVGDATTGKAIAMSIVFG